MAETISSFLPYMISPLSMASLSPSERMNRSLFVRATMPNGWEEEEEEANSGGSAR